ncbi:MAG: hypothetical protein ACKOPS_03810, partial [Cyanobium sp.]
MIEKWHFSTNSQGQQDQDGWRLAELNDLSTSDGDGKRSSTYAHIYEHPDGRRATVFANGVCTDP